MITRNYDLYIMEERLDKILIQRKLVSSRTRAEKIIKEVGVKVDGKLITKTGKSGANTDFRFEGNLKSEINSLSIAYKRLYSIHCAAISLREMMDNNPYPLAFLMDEPMDQNYPFKKYMKQISFGYGWGAITKLHTMADLGCAVKPDLHVCRTIHHLGMCPEIPTSVENPNLEQSIIINLACMELLSELQKRFPEEGYRLRSLDYILMRISLNSLL